MKEKTYSNVYKDKRAHTQPMGSKYTLRLMRTLGPSLGSLVQSTWSLLSNALAGQDCITQPMGSKSTLRLMRTLGPSLGSLAQSTWSLLSNALAGQDCIILHSHFWKTCPRKMLMFSFPITKIKIIFWVSIEIIFWVQL